MKLEDIKKEAALCKCDDLKSLSIKVTELKNKGVTFLGCVAFVQTNQNIPLNGAVKLTLNLDVYSKEEKHKIKASINRMLNDFEE